MEHIDALVASGLAELGLAGRAAPDAPARMDRFCALLLERNRVMNLTALTRPEDVASLHMLDSAALLACPGVDFNGARVLDVGAGAGFPGLALGLLLPDLSVTLLDSQEKRVGFLEDAARELGISGVRAVHGRAEELGRDAAWRESFDLVTARAVAGLPMLCELCLPFVRTGGRFLAMKGPDPAQEIADAQRAIAGLGGGAAEVFRYALPHSGSVHTVVCIEKTAPTPERYPRRWKRIQNAPL